MTRLGAQYLYYMVLALNRVAFQEAGSNIGREIHRALPGLETSFITVWRYITSRETRWSLYWSVQEITLFSHLLNLDVKILAAR